MSVTDGTLRGATQEGREREMAMIDFIMIFVIMGGTHQPSQQSLSIISLSFMIPGHNTFGRPHSHKHLSLQGSSQKLNRSCIKNVFSGWSPDVWTTYVNSSRVDPACLIKHYDQLVIVEVKLDICRSPLKGFIYLINNLGK